MKSLRALLTASLLLLGCAPGVTDGEYPIKNGYFLYETGRNGKTIEFKDRNGVVNSVIPERVDSYIVDGAKIIAARRPAASYMRGEIADWRLESTCEYWMIDTITHSVEQIAVVSEWPSVRCDMSD